MNNIKTIREVIAALDYIVQDCVRTQNRAGYFAALYKRMTMAVSEGIANNLFEDGPRMEQLDIAFANRYLDAYEAFQNKQKCTSSWHGAFTGCGNTSLIMLQYILLGINTHINLDLAIASANVAPGDNIHALEIDFHNINNIIASLVDDVQSCLEQVWHPMHLIDRVLNEPEHGVLNFGIGIARKRAWSNAVLLANMDKELQEEHIMSVDARVQVIGNRIINPGILINPVLHLIRSMEHGDVGKNIQLIDTTGLA